MRQLKTGDKVLAKTDGDTIWTVVNTTPITRNRVRVQSGALREYRAVDSLKVLTKAELTILSAYDSVMSFE
jgi:ribosomal protein S8